MSEPSASKAGAGLVLALCASVLVWCQGCAMTPMERARTIVEATAESVVAVDRIIAPRYAAVVGAGAANPAELARWNRAVEALLLTRAALMTADVALDAVEAGQDGDVAGVMACVAVAVGKLLDALPEVGVDLPDALVMAMHLVTGLASGSCDPGDHVVTDGVPHVSEVVTP